MKPKWLVIITILWLIGLLLCIKLEAKDDQKRFLPPTYEGIVRLHCTCNLISTHGEQWWHTHVMIVYKEITLIKLYSIRPPNERKKALADCDRWMEYVRKNAPKPKPKKLPVEEL